LARTLIILREYIKRKEEIKQLNKKPVKRDLQIEISEDGREEAEKNKTKDLENMT